MLGTSISFLLLILIKVLSADDVPVANSKLHEELNKKTKNSICCAKKLKCCKKPSCSPDIAIRSVLVRCPNTACEDSLVTRSFKRPVSYGREHDIRHFQGFDEDEPLSRSDVTNCHKKLVITMKLANKGNTNCKSEYVVIDHVYDPVSERKARLLNPYVIKIKQEKILQLYGLRFLHVVNSEAKEVVYNKHDANYTGCDTTSKKPTCGKVKYKGKTIPYSKGFCCSCDVIKNAKRQPENTSPSIDPIIGYSDPSYLMEGVHCQKNTKENHLKEDFTDLNIAKERKDEDIESTYGKDESNILHETFDDALKSKKCSQRKYKVKVFSTSPKMDPLLAGLFNRKNTTTAFDIVTQANIERQSKGIPESGTFLSDDDNPSNKQHKQKYENAWMAAESFNKQAQKYRRSLNAYPYKKQANEIDQEIENVENNEIKFTKDEKKRQVQSSGLQRRGGQNCADRYTPPHLNPETYHESTHCLRFSDLWYTVYELRPPIVEHSVLIQIFEKHENAQGKTEWIDLTRGKTIRVGTLKDHYIECKSTLAVRYRAPPCKVTSNQFSLDYNNVRLLIPEGTKKCDLTKYPEFSGGPPEYLVVRPEHISLYGDQCNTAGVGYEAFFKQPNRCSVPRGSCLANQPKHLWYHDHAAEKHGRRSCFFLKNFGKIPDKPIRKNISGDEQFLAMEYVGFHGSTLDFEIKSDFNTILRPQASAQITEVYIDSTYPTKTIITVKVTNSGLISSVFSTRISDCPMELPASLNNIQSKQVLIPPQHQHIFTLEIKCTLPADRFHCSVEVLNCKYELVALRRIRLQKFDRCICTWHCLCACVASLEGLKCIPMSLEHYHAAGFQGALPVPTYVVNYTFFDEILSTMVYFTFFLLFTLLGMGLTKALIGLCCCGAVGLWGLNILLDIPRKMSQYYEGDLAGRPVVYDEEGWPVHPDTREKVRNISRSTEFCMNVVFFITYPLGIFILLLKRICCPYYTYDSDDRDCNYRFEEVHNISISEMPNRHISTTVQANVCGVMSSNYFAKKQPQSSSGEGEACTSEQKTADAVYEEGEEKGNKEDSDSSEDFDE